MLAGLLAESHLMPLEQLPAKVAEHAEPAGLAHVAIYLTDLQRHVLRNLAEEGMGGCRRGIHTAELRIEGTVPGRAFQYGRLLPAASACPGKYRWWAPLLGGTERLGVLRVTTEGDDHRTRQDVQLLADVVALIVVSKRDYSDAYARLIRTDTMNVAAEMLWRLLPPRAYSDGRVVISATLEPAYRVGGDAFDYVLDGPLIHLSIFDAMGHDTAAGLTAGLAMGACRNARRRNADLVEITEEIEKVLIEQFGGTRYATGIVARLDTGTGLLEWVNRGHHPPVLIRGGRWVTQLACPPGDPMGTGLGVAPEVCREQLEPGDRLVLYTDGITEARTATGGEFGLSGFIDFLIRQHADRVPVPETLCRFMHRVVDHHVGEWQDDATVLFCEWLGSSPDRRDLAAAVAGVPLLWSGTDAALAQGSGIDGELPLRSDAMAPERSS
ncbi:PP2C family protein-serine/threonine phosphatase [Streptomyces sp. NPDC005133]|uniref:PP2C family protein-serine/threonine phosphatase n=1 Tax=Streptomyces sp. NPDC005246 TaxID=3156716 RepID=UPI0033A2D0C9